jgi:mono/diheme cytochrome c family protein
VRRTALVLATLVLLLAGGLAAGCGGEEEATPTPDTITGTLTTDTETTTEETTDEETTDEETTDEETTDEETTTDTGATGEGDPAAGKEVFLGAGGCGSCHTFADAGSTGAIGPNLDDSAPSFELAVDRVTNGQGAMPSFSEQLSEQQIADVAAYVSGG